jgi:para-aminobenzoate synthetase component 1
MWSPLVEEIYTTDPLKLFHYFASSPGAIFFDSSKQIADLGRYSFIGLSPFLSMRSKNGQIILSGEQYKIIENACPFAELQKHLARFSLKTLPGLPPFQTGAAGLFSYDLVHHLEKIPPFKTDDMQFVDMAIGFYDLVIAFDNLFNKAYIFSSGYPELELSAREQRAKTRLDWLLNEIAKINTSPEPNQIPIRAQDIQSNFSKTAYLQAVEKTRDYILAGDLFEGTVSQRFKAILPDTLTPYDLYLRLRQVNQAPFSGYFNIDNQQIIASASPERFLKLHNHKVETRPIKGTRPRSQNPIEDKKLIAELQSSEKDQAENVMIVDLMRNDLSRVCLDHTVTVPQLCKVETYPTVHHLVSVVQGTLQPDLGPVDLLRATFPGGSITGAPKIRAMEIIAEVEPTSRGPYTGSLGYISFDGNLDSSILIRSFCIQNNQVTFQVGGAIVLDSNPLQEYEETHVKAKGLMRALTGENK